MKIPKIRVHNCTLATAQQMGFDIVQSKATGEPCRVEVSRGELRIYGYNGEPIKDFLVDNKTAGCSLLGSYFSPLKFSQERVAVYDCLAITQEEPDELRLVYTDISRHSYRDRFAFVKQQLSMLNLTWFTAVTNRPIGAVNDLWDSLHPEFSNGIVYRRSTDPWMREMWVARKYPSIPGGVP